MKYNSVNVFLATFISMILASVVMTVIIGLSFRDADDKADNMTSYCNLVFLERQNVVNVYYDKETKVMYYIIANAGITPVYNSDGSFKLYEGDEKKNE